MNDDLWAIREVFRVKKMTWIDWALLIFAAVVVVGAVLGNDEGLSLVFKGGAGKYQGFEASSFHKWMVFFTGLAMLISYAGYRFTIAAAKENYAEYQSDFDQKERKDREARMQAEREQAENARREEREAFESRIAALEGEVTVLRDEPDFRLVQAVSRLEPVAPGDLVIPHTVVRHLLDDAFGEKQLAVVYHLFDGSAAWEYNSATNSEPADFFQKLYSSPTAATLSTYDYLIGIGLASNSPSQVLDMSHRRAKYLCGAIEAILPFNNHTPVYGLAIGDYQSGTLDVHNKPQPGQRPILIAGVERESPSLNEQALILEMMMSFDYSGIDLRGYSMIGDGEKPSWYEITDCDRDLLEFGR